MHFKLWILLAQGRKRTRFWEFTWVLVSSSHTISPSASLQSFWPVCRFQIWMISAYSMKSTRHYLNWMKSGDTYWALKRHHRSQKKRRSLVRWLWRHKAFPHSNSESKTHSSFQKRWEHICLLTSEPSGIRLFYAPEGTWSQLHIHCAFVTGNRFYLILFLLLV